MKRVLLTILRVLRNVVIGLVLVVLFGLWILRNPKIQERLLPVAESILEERLGVPVTVESVDLDLPARIVLRNAAMFDKQDRRMFAIHEAQISLLSFSLWNLILHPRQTQSLSVQHIQLLQPEAYIYRSRRDSSLNIDFLSGSPDTSSKKPLPLYLDLPEVRIRSGIFTYIDSTRSDAELEQRGRINYNNMQFRRINGELGFELLPDQNMNAHIRSLSVAEDRAPFFLNEFSGKVGLNQDADDPDWLLICLDDTRVRTGRTNLSFSGQLQNLRPDTAKRGFFPVFSADFLPSIFDFTTLNYLIPKSLPMHDPAMIQGFVWGDMEAIRSDSLFVGIYEETRLKMRTELTGYTRPGDLHFDLGIMEGSMKFGELNRFLPGTDVPLAGLVKVKGDVIGDLDQLKTKDFQLNYGEKTDLLVKARMYDYTKGDALFMDISFFDSHFSFDEIGRMVPDMNLPPWLNRFGRTGIHGKFIGGVNDFVVNANMGSAYGEVDANLHLQLPPVVQEIGYEGWIKTRNLNFEALQADLPITSRYFNFEGQIKGHGSEFGKLVADIDGQLVDSDIEGYHLDKVKTDSLRIRGFKIDGGVHLTDAQGNASFTVDMLLADTAKKNVNMYGDVASIDLDHYDILPGDSVKFSAVVNVHLDGDSLEDFTGSLRFYVLNLIREGTEDTLNVSRFVLESQLNEQHEHFLKLRSTLMNMSMRGTFTYDKAARLMGRLSREISMYIQNNDSVISRYYATKVLEPEDVQIWDTIRVRDELNEVLAFFQVPVYIEPGTMLYGHLSHGITDNVDIQIRSDSIAVANVGLKDDTISLNVFKDGSKNELLLIGEVLVDKVSVGGNLNFRNVIFRPEGDDSMLDYELRADQPDIGNQYILQARTLFLKEGKVFTQILPEASVLRIKGKEWRFAEGNYITREYSTPPSLGAEAPPDSLISRYFVKNLSLSESGQRISVNGAVSRDFLDILNVRFHKVRISSLLEILETPMGIDGIVDNTKVSAYNLLGDHPTLDWNVNVDNFHYQPDDSIDVRFRGGWPQDEKGEIARVELEMGHFGQDSLVVTGEYNVVADSLNLVSDKSSILLYWAEPLLKGVLSDMEGKMTIDHFSVRGPLSSPRLNGTVHLADAGFKVDYLNNVFRLSDNELTFDNQKVTIPGITVMDTFGGSAELKGVVINRNGDFDMDISLMPIRNLTVMDTRKGQNPDFYGRVVLDGDSAKVTGSVTKPFLQAWITTGQGTWLDIPLSDYTSANRLDFVHFIREGDTLNTDSTLDLGGFSLRITVQATDDARIRLIFDEKVGDIIEARGEGAITLDITEDGEFYMQGPFVVKEGNYLFTAENIVNKKFLVDPGGSIIWNGDPYDAQVSLNAIYKVNADISALVPNATSRVPVDIVMRMSGSLMQPKIDLELRVDQLSSGDVMGLASYFRTIQYDQQELNKQVVSLLLFRRFTGHAASGNGGVAGAGVTSSISELISNQVNFWISQAFDNANVGVELNTNEFQDVELALKASLFNNKVTVERNGAIVGNNGGGFSIGDLSVQIKLLPASDSGRVNPQAGQLVMEIFNREDATLNTANNVSRGLGLFYKKDFDRISDLFKRKDQRKMEDRPSLLDEEEDQIPKPPQQPEKEKRDTLPPVPERDEGPEKQDSLPPVPREEPEEDR